MTTPARVDRREFIKVGALAGGGMLLAIYAPGAKGQNPAAAPFQPSAFLRIEPSGEITITVARSDMGQGVRTALPMIIAEELDADWNAVRVRQADAHPNQYGRMMTVGSSSVRNGAWLPLRKAGAAAREMLVAAAAARWGVSASDLRTESGRVLHGASARSASYGELAEAAAALPVPAEPQLKDPATFKLIGTSPALFDTPDKVTGRAKYGIDARVTGMLFATVVHPPVFGSRVKSFDAAKAKAVAGVRHVVQIPTGIAVVAEHTGAAFKGAQALTVEYENSGFAMSSPDIFRSFADLADKPGTEARRVGDATGALPQSVKRVQSTYEAPYLAHATMEPMNCTANVQADRVELWAPTQNPQGAQQTAAQITGVPISNVTVHVQLLGCGWGRRSRQDFVEDAVHTSKAVGAPVQVLWTREEDMQHDFYRPAAHVRLDAGLDGAGKLAAMTVRVAAQPISGGGAVDGPAVASIADTPYAIPNYLVEYCRATNEVPVGYWRSVGPSQNTFIFESFIDELAHAAKRDPFEFRREMLTGDPRLLRVLELAAEKSGWANKKPGNGRALGMAAHRSFLSFIAAVVEVET
ncbi:MAG TPA: molybdopterin cofactor-binding domain-containing protein, partial [Gemmatimonadaceae bacterium]